MLNNEVFNIFSIMSVVVPILVIGIFIFVFAIMFSPKLRGKMMSKQIESLKHMANYSKEDLENIGTTMSEIAINTKKNIYDNNEDKLRDIVEKGSDLSSITVEKTARAIKKGLQDNIYCKYCGKSIDADSKFCKNCGKQL